MPAEAIVRNQHALIRARTLLGIATLLGGTISFCGWAFDVHRFTDWFDGGVSIQPNPSVLIVLAGIALVLLQSGPRQLVAILGAVIAAVGMLTLSQYILGIDFGFNHQLTFGRDWGDSATMSPGRMGPPASASFTLIGTAFLLLGLRPDAASRVRRFVPMLGVAVGVIGMFSLIGHLFDAKPLYTLPWLTAIALQTALMLIALAVGLVMAVPDREPLRLLLSDSGAGALARRIVPALVLLPPLLGLLRTRGEFFGYFDDGTGKALLILSIAMLSVALLWWALLALARHEASDRESAKAVLQEQQLVAETLRHANQRKNEFLAILAHELRGPLAPLRNSLELMKRADRDEPMFGRAHTIMDRQLSHLARLVDDLIDVSRITRDRIEIRREPTELRNLLGSCIEACRPFTEERGQHVDLAAPATPVYVEADQVRLTQVFSNILNNASKYTDQGGRISCVAEHRDDEIVVSIGDSGIGIAPDQLDSVFEMFTQIDHGPAWARGGLGIGLTLAKRLVELHGGSISAHSSGHGQGSEFVVRLPLASQPSPAEEDGRAIPSPVTESRRVLLVDDNLDTATSLAVLFQIAGHETAVAHEGIAAIETAAGFRPHVILLDIGLPGMSGYDICRRLRERSWAQAITIIALTGWGQEADREKSRAAGFDHHLVKPVDFPELLALVTAGRAEQTS